MHWSDRTVAVDLSREAVKTAPTYDAALTLDRPGEASLYSHHGRPPYWKAGEPLERKS